MLQQISLLIILVMVGLLSSNLWEREPADSIKHAQESRVKKVSVFSFHE